MLAHCGSALTRLAEGTMHQFTPGQNELDVAARRSWPLQAVVSELERGYSAAAPVVAAAQGKLDGGALAVTLTRPASGSTAPAPSNITCSGRDLAAARP